MTGIIKKTTANYNLRIPIFDAPGWGRELERNFEIIDSVMLAISGFTNIVGTWTNGTSYSVGDRVVDSDLYTIFVCEVAHTSAASGSFSDDRTANPTFWSPVTTTASNRGNWTTATEYNINDFVVDTNRFGIVIEKYTSGASYDADVAGSKIVTLIDISAQMTTAVNSAAAAAASASAASISETNAETAETNAETAETNAAASAVAASNSASSASGSATAAGGSATAAANSALAASVSATDADADATAAALSATAAANTYDLFDDRMLGAKAADPTLDNDGNALQVGAMYWNTAASNLRFWSGSTWVVSTLNGLGVFIHGLTAKNDLANTDEFAISDSANSWDQRKVTATRLKAYTSDDPIFTGTVNGAPYGGQNRNYLINGNFDVWQRGVSQTSHGYGSDDRWHNQNVGSTKVHSIQTFTMGQTTVPGIPRHFSRTVVTSVAGAGNYVAKQQAIERVETLAGKTITLTFWAKADASKPMSFDFFQFFGSGGSPSTLVQGIGATKVNLTTSWQKFSRTVSIPSVSGKTLGTSNTDSLVCRFWFDAGSSHNANTVSLGQQSGTFDLAHVSIVEGDATNEDDPFPHRSLDVEYALCYRYFRVFALRGTWNAGAVDHYFSFYLPVDKFRHPPAVVTNFAVNGAGSFNYKNITVYTNYQIFWQSVAAGSIALEGSVVQECEL